MDRIRSNILKMIDAGAPESDIDAYIQSEGMTLEQVRNKGAQPEARSAETYGANEAVKYGLTGGLGEEVGAAGATAADALMAATSGQWDEFSIKDAYSRNLSAKDQARKAYHQKNPVLAPVAELGGGLLMGGGVARAGAAVPTIKGMAATGAGIGAASGAAEDNENRLRGAGVGALLGGGMGLGMGAVGRALSRRGTAPPTVDNLKDTAGRLYKTAKEADVLVKPHSYSKAINDLSPVLKEAGYHEKLHPKVSVVLDEWAKAQNEPQTLQSLDQLRRLLKSARASIEPDERRVAGIVTERFDDFIENLSPEDVLSGDANKSAVLKQARALWSKMRKTETVGELVERAKIRASQFSGSGYENALRTEFRNLAMSPKKMRGFSDAERKAIWRVAKGGPVGNVLRALGKFAPTGVVSSTLGGGFGGAAGAVLGGPTGAAIGGGGVMLAGAGARKGAEVLTSRNARMAAELMRGGRSAPSLTSEQVKALRALLVAGAVPSAQAPVD